jgi:predicted RNase H-like nuclease (RuvC/YqgF family)
VAVGQWDATEIEKIDIQETIEELRRQNKLLEIDNAALRDSRDMYQNRCSELLRQVKALQAKVKKAGIE